MDTVINSTAIAAVAAKAPARDLVSLATLPVLFVFGVVGNLLLIVVMRDKEYRKMTAKYIMTGDVRDC